MASSKTYLLAPNFNFKPGGAIALGNILVNPFRPHRILSALDPNSPKKPEIEVAPDYNYEITRYDSHGAKMSLFARFLQTVGLNVNAEKDFSSLSIYKMDCLETHHLKHEPTVEEITERLKKPEVKAVLKYGMLGLVAPGPLYIITGLKIAKGLSVSTEESAGKGGGAGATIPMSENISAGGDVLAHSRGMEKINFRAGGDVVFAYEVMKITVRGNEEEKRGELEDYYPKAAFLGQEEVEEDDDAEPFVIEGVVSATAADFEVTAGDLHVLSYKTDEGETYLSNGAE